jgi:hypothetical protein
MTDCNHPKESLNRDNSAAVQLNASGKYIGAGKTKGHTLGVQPEPKCTRFDECQPARDQILERFRDLQKQLEAGTEQVDDDPVQLLKVTQAEFHQQVGRFAQQAESLDIDQDTLEQVWESSKKLNDAIEDFQEEVEEQENVVVSKLRDIPYSQKLPKVENLPKEAQAVEGTKVLTNTVQERVVNNLEENHDVTEDQLEERYNEESQTPEQSKESQSEDETQETEEEKETNERVDTDENEDQSTEETTTEKEKQTETRDRRQQR